MNSTKVVRGWSRVVVGLQKVVQVATAHSGSDLAIAAERLSRHGSDLLQQSVSALNHYHHPQSRHANDILKHPHASPHSSPSHDPLSVLAPTAHTSTPFTTNTSASSLDPTNTNTIFGSSLSDNALLQPTIPSLHETVSTTIHSSLSPLPPSSSSVHDDLRSPASTAHDRDDALPSAALSDPTISPQISNDQNELRPLLEEGAAVPSTRLGRALGFASLGVGLVTGSATEGLRRLFLRNSSSSPDAANSTISSSLLVTDANADRVAASLCRMRGAAMKMGQMLSIQDESLLPPTLTRALRHVRQGAQAMPHYQLVQQLERQLGVGWRHKFVTFDERPMAAASIGQVHRATIATSDPTNAQNTIVRDVVVKVQYPGVARSIESDLNNLGMLVSLSGLAPKGLFIDNVIRVGREELQVECDYVREMRNQTRMQQHVSSDPVLTAHRFLVPHVFEHLTTEEVITSSYLPGGTIDQVSHLDQDERNRIARTIMYLTMQELFVWRFMQTDPNWGNFLYDMGTRTTGLIDFGATREYSKAFVDGYLRIVWASANKDTETLMTQSRRMNFLTGDENAEMLEAHEMSGFTVGEPFWSDEPFDFRGSNISTRMGAHTAVFLQHRLTAPPEEVYTLHRKLAGAYMLCIKLDARISLREMLADVVRNHHFEDGLDPPSQ